MQQYSFDMESVSQQKFIDTNCNSIIFFNAGDATVLIENLLPLEQSQQFAIDGNEKELLIKRVSVSFVPGSGDVNNLIIIRKNFVQ